MCRILGVSLRDVIEPPISITKGLRLWSGSIRCDPHSSDRATLTRRRTPADRAARTSDTVPSTLTRRIRAPACSVHVRRDVIHAVAALDSRRKARRIGEVCLDGLDIPARSEAGGSTERCIRRKERPRALSA